MTPKSYRFLSIAEAAKRANVSKEKIRKVCKVRTSRDGQHVSELELIRIFGEPNASAKSGTTRLP